jgi:hypothetical protein
MLVGCFCMLSARTLEVRCACTAGNMSCTAVVMHQLQCLSYGTHSHCSAAAAVLLCGACLLAAADVLPNGLPAAGGAAQDAGSRKRKGCVLLLCTAAPLI